MNNKRSYLFITFETESVERAWTDTQVKGNRYSNQDLPTSFKNVSVARNPGKREDSLIVIPSKARVRYSHQLKVYDYYYILYLNKIPLPNSKIGLDK